MKEIKSDYTYCVKRYLSDRPVEWYWQDLLDFLRLTGGASEVQREIVGIYCKCGGVGIDGIYEKLELYYGS